MDLYERFRSAAAEQGIPEDEVDRFAGLMRLSIWVNPRHEGRLIGHPDGEPAGQDCGVPAGRAGGLPRFPAGMEWPVNGNDDPLPFAATFDCAALPQVHGLPLPTDGTLLVFLHHENANEEYDPVAEQQHARIVHIPAGAETTVAAEPDHEDVVFHDDRDFLAPERDLYPVVHADLPEWLDADDLSEYQQEQARDLPHRRELCALAATIWPRGTYTAFRFGGYTDGIGAMYTDHLYETPELTMAADGLDDPDDYRLEQELRRVERDWIPLIQFDPADVYLARFLIRLDDLTAGRFDQARSCTAFTE